MPDEWCSAHCLAWHVTSWQGLIEPVEMVKQMDARVGLTQGMMAEVSHLQREGGWEGGWEGERAEF